ncbi:MAG: RedB protein [Polyangia bacterium]
MSRRIVLGVLLWIGLALAGVLRLAAFDTTPGALGPLRMDWPKDSALQPAGPTLLLFLHGKCPCSMASLSELEQILARHRGPLSVHVFVFRPRAPALHWTETSLWKRVSELPGVQAHWDDDGTEARRFGALTSGEALLWGARGRLLFRGGITPWRGHAGENAGRATILALLETESAAIRSTSVYGCPITGTDRARGSAATEKP